ncbi:MAG: multicopper oxidase domain-containing protein, partial [Gemmataceae bacterium]|nr:multicopper oxidase domain-containing protein [Gemmataceae bacterium]
MPREVIDLKVGRRGFLKKAAAGAAVVPMAGGLIAAACNDETAGAGQKAVDYKTPEPGAEKTAVAAVPADTSKVTQAGHDWQTIDQQHKKGIEDFLKNQTTPITKGEGNVLVAPRIENGVKVWDITCDEIEWETVPGKIEKGRGYNKMIPGPILRGTVGDKVRINVTNNLEESTAVHWHGLIVPNNQDGVPFLTQPPIEPGKTFTYEFTLRNSGSHMYHSHHNSADQVNRGLLGAFIVDPAPGSPEAAAMPKFDKEYVLVLNDVALGFTINGKGFPATKALTAKKGQRVLLRWINEGLMNHPMHLHGMPMEVWYRDGWPVVPPYKVDTIDVPAGNRF